MAIICINTQIPPKDSRDATTGSMDISFFGSVIILLISSMQAIIDETVPTLFPVM